MKTGTWTVATAARVNAAAKPSVGTLKAQIRLYSASSLPCDGRTRAGSFVAPSAAGRLLLGPLSAAALWSSRFTKK